MVLGEYTVLCIDIIIWIVHEMVKLFFSFEKKQKHWRKLRKGIEKLYG